MDGWLQAPSSGFPFKAHTCCDTLSGELILQPAPKLPLLLVVCRLKLVAAANANSSFVMLLHDTPLPRTSHRSCILKQLTARSACHAPARQIEFRLPFFSPTASHHPIVIPLQIPPSVTCISSAFYHHLYNTPEVSIRFPSNMPPSEPLVVQFSTAVHHLCRLVVRQSSNGES